MNSRNGWEVHVGAVKASQTNIFTMQVLGMVPWLQEASGCEKAEEEPLKAFQLFQRETIVSRKREFASPGQTFSCIKVQGKKI